MEAGEGFAEALEGVVFGEAAGVEGGDEYFFGVPSVAGFALAGSGETVGGEEVAVGLAVGVEGVADAGGEGQGACVVVFDGEGGARGDGEGGAFGGPVEPFPAGVDGFEFAQALPGAEEDEPAELAGMGLGGLQ